LSENGQTVVYEQPLNERVRTFLRLEFLFQQHHHHRADKTHWGVRATLRALLDIYTVVSRSDLATTSS
jgi:cell division protein ZapD